MFAVHGLCEYLRTGSLASAAGTHEKIRMREPAVLDLTPERVSYMFLSDDVAKGSRTPFSVQRLIQDACLLSVDYLPRRGERPHTDL